MTSRVALLGEYAANQDNARDLILGLSAAQWNFRNPGGWSVADCLEHLSQSNTAFGGAIAAAIEDPVARAQSRSSSRLTRWLESWMIHLIEPPARLKFKAPAQLQPVRREWGKEILDSYVESHQSLLTALRDPSIEIEEVRFRHPVRRLEMTILAGLRAMAAHDRRHLWQARAIAAGFELK